MDQLRTQATAAPRLAESPSVNRRIEWRPDRRRAVDRPGGQFYFWTNTNTSCVVANHSNSDLLHQPLSTISPCAEPRRHFCYRRLHGGPLGTALALYRFAQWGVFVPLGECTALQRFDDGERQRRPKVRNMPCS